MNDYRHGNKPVDTIEATFAAIEEAGDPGIFISLVDRDKALAAARELGGRIDPTKPLYGVPFAVKDNIDVAGMPTTVGCPEYAYTPAKSAPVVDRLTEAGAILVGKTNLDQFATGLVGVRTPYPVPRNAVDPSLVPGGSSSGSAVATARGIVAFALGTDTAGSGRIPAGLNNIVGLKPSVGALSTSGLVPACRTLDCISVFALGVDDAFAVFSIAAGYDPTDPYSRRMALGALHRRAEKMKIGVPSKASRKFFGDRDMEAGFDTALGMLTSFGADIVEIDFTEFYATADLLYEGAWVAERYAAIRDFIEAQPDSLHPVTRTIIEGATRLSAADAFAGQYR
ncbi:MAG: allophanate hydrolase, partial [Bauldia sp.]|nr:allophanate hydrolase [Bauldia sp.]